MVSRILTHFPVGRWSRTLLPAELKAGDSVALPIQSWIYKRILGAGLSRGASESPDHVSRLSVVERLATSNKHRVKLFEGLNIL